MTKAFNLDFKFVFYFVFISEIVCSFDICPFVKVFSFCFLLFFLILVLKMRFSFLHSLLSASLRARYHVSACRSHQ